MLVGALMGTSLATPVLAAANEACLQSNRIWGWQAINDRTLIVTDRTYKKYTVHLTGGCVNISKYVGTNLAFQSVTSLGCIGQGDGVRFVSRDLGPLRCIVTGVDAGVPAPAPG
jgi:hypothetical protein